MVYELKPQYDARKSFYGKAQVEVGGESGEDKFLHSYGVLVAKRELGKGVTLLPQWNASQTTVRHVKEFLLQEGYQVSNKADIAEQFLK